MKAMLLALAGEVLRKVEAPISVSAYKSYC